MPRRQFAFGVLVAGALIARAAFGQIPAESRPESEPNASFELVSVKADPARSRTEAGPPTLSMHPSGRFTALNVTVRQLIMNAYGIRSSQIIGGPDWMGHQFFDILAEAPDDFEMGQTRAMMRRLLEDRFGLVAQRTTTAMPVFFLEWIDKQERNPGLWLRRPSSECDRPPTDPPEVMVGQLGAARARRSERRAESKPDPECRASWGTTAVFATAEPWFYARRVALSSILEALGTFVGKPVIDNTGLTGDWDLDIKWDRDTSDARRDAGTGYGSIFTAVREQLGLTLEPRNSNEEVLVIERVERPSPN